MSVYRIPQVALSPDAGDDELRRRVERILRIDPRAVGRITVERRSVDARDKGAVKLVYGLTVEVDHGKSTRIPASAAVPVAPEQPYPEPRSWRSFSSPPVVVGSGPAGLFAALILAEAGTKPIVLERGESVEERDRTVKAFYGGAELDVESNIQFGEGGAGTYSDGKLNTQVKDTAGRRGKVIRELIAAGAAAEIAVLAKPHVGTDVLLGVVAALRRRIIALGGKFSFRARMDDLFVSDGRLAGVSITGLGRIDTEALILAPGHSARDTFALLADRGVRMEAKSFAVGLRIEHPQELISRSQYGKFWNHPALGAADYRLASRTSDDRGVYSFCMCPGGSVVNASSEQGGVVCNGMSDYARDGKNANAAIVVAVGPGDFGGGVLGGVEFQRRWERAAFAAAGGGHALPIQLLGSLAEGRLDTTLGGIAPSAGRAWRFADLRPCLPPFVLSGILEGIARFGKSLEGFERRDAVLSGVETRTSSPVRILRNEGCESSLHGLFPAGEGAGYAGGIMSAAMDGIRVAEAVLSCG